MSEPETLYEWVRKHRSSDLRVEETHTVRSRKIPKFKKISKILR